MTNDVNLNCTYDQALSFREGLMGVDQFSAEKWEAVRQQYATYEAAREVRATRERRIASFENALLLACVIVGCIVGGAFGSDLLILGGIALPAMGAVAIRRLFFMPTLKHKLSAFGPSDFNPVRPEDYNEVWQMASNNGICLDYITKALAHRGELLFIELVDLRHHDYARQTAQALANGERTKALLSSPDPKVKEFMLEQMAAVEFYRNNPTVALIDWRRCSKESAAIEPASEVSNG